MLCARNIFGKKIFFLKKNILNKGNILNILKTHCQIAFHNYSAFMGSLSYVEMSGVYQCLNEGSFSNSQGTCEAPFLNESSGAQ